VRCAPGEHRAHAVRSGLYKLNDLIENAQHLGIDPERLADAAQRDPAITEFCRFYLERRAQEVKAAGDDVRKRKKLEDDFTPRLEFTVVALEGNLHREVTVEAQYRFAEGPAYARELTAVPHTGAWLAGPELGRCESTDQAAPRECLDRCAMTNAEVLRHRLVRSELSGRMALPEHTVQCAMSGKRLLLDEAEISAVTGRPIARPLLKTCALTGKRAEPEHFGSCAFTGAEVLSSALAVSEVSGQHYRPDQQLRSGVSGKAGHKDEFVYCYEPMVPIEAERCSATGHLVRPGVLETCAASGKAVLPAALQRCSVSGQRVLKTLLVSSSVSGAQLLPRIAVKSVAGQYCAPAEAKTCMWSGRSTHPDDLRTCALSGIPFHVEFASSGAEPQLQPLAELLHGLRRTTDAEDYWEDIASKAAAALRGGRCRVESAHVSPDQRHLAICSEVRTMLGLRVHQAGLLYSIEDGAIVGRIAMGKRTPKGWVGASH
jgi:hypothetical protein